MKKDAKTKEKRDQAAVAGAGAGKAREQTGPVSRVLAVLIE